MIRAVTFGGVNEVDAAIRRCIEDGIHLLLGEVDAPFAAELPGADADDGRLQTGFAESSIAHNQIMVRNLFQGNKERTSLELQMGRSVADGAPTVSRLKPSTIRRRPKRMNFLTPVAGSVSKAGHRPALWRRGIRNRP